MTSKQSNQSTQGHKTKKHFNNLAILPCQKLISIINIQVLRPKLGLVLMAIESTRLQSKSSQSRILVFLKTKNPSGLKNLALKKRKKKSRDVRLHAFKVLFPLVYGSQY